MLHTRLKADSSSSFDCFGQTQSTPKRAPPLFIFQKLIWTSLQHAMSLQLRTAVRTVHLQKSWSFAANSVQKSTALHKQFSTKLQIDRLEWQPQSRTVNLRLQSRFFKVDCCILQ